MMEENIFRDAKFGDVFLTRDGRKAIYHKYEMEKSEKIHYLIIEPHIVDFPDATSYLYAPYKAYVNVNGKGYPESLKTYDLENKDSFNYNQVIDRRMSDK